MSDNIFRNDRILDMKINPETLSLWRCCCFEKKTDSRLIKFIAVYLIIFIVFIFTLVMLFYSHSCEDQTLYMSLLTLLLGLIIPHP